jgi:hypothetical protein
VTGPSHPLVPAGFVVPAGLSAELFVLEPLDFKHNESDYAAWTSSIEHIKATPGFGGRTWLDLDLSLADNAADIGVPPPRLRRPLNPKTAHIERTPATLNRRLPRQPG